ncbi:hypothetical protein WMY93_008779 [Mugilogobius chulae]|uniref:Uncharacterized protein n=1 Tax=Mugilogobius chulae TaxID=88201 RepID=A0AAW0PKX3_9GOBI
MYNFTSQAEEEEKEAEIVKSKRGRTKKRMPENFVSNGRQGFAIDSSCLRELPVARDNRIGVQALFRQPSIPTDLHSDSDSDSLLFRQTSTPTAFCSDTFLGVKLPSSENEPTAEMDGAQGSEVSAPGPVVPQIEESISARVTAEDKAWTESNSNRLEWRLADFAEAAFLSCKKHTQKGGSLSTSCRRETFMLEEFKIVQPVEYSTCHAKQTVVYVPILKMLNALLNKDEILEKVLSVDTNCDGFCSYRDGLRFKENVLLTEEGYRIALGLYIDDFEVANPLGTSKKKHKVCAVYWVLLNIENKFRSSLNAIQLALMCKVNTVKECGYSEVLHPLLQDLVHLEKSGVYVERLGSSIRGTVLYMAADNLAAHSLAGFQESFVSDKICRFCMATKDEIQNNEVSSGYFRLRTKDEHKQHVQEVKENPYLAKEYGVKGSCPLSKLEHFQVVNGFAPDILHDLLEGVIPYELSICIDNLIKKKYFTFDMLNNAIKTFPYTHTDKTNQPQPIPKTFHAKGTIGGNGHENWTLLRLLPLMIGRYIPEGDETWEVILCLKDVLELAMSTKFTEDTIDYLNIKLSEHRALLKSAFPNYKLRPKHHYLEHYPSLICVFGPLADVWTMRFEGKHKFFKE